jgi:hypothetical protein
MSGARLAGRCRIWAGFIKHLLPMDFSGLTG